MSVLSVYLCFKSNDVTSSPIILKAGSSGQGVKSGWVRWGEGRDSTGIKKRQKLGILYNPYKHTYTCMNTQSVLAARRGAWAALASSSSSSFVGSVSSSSFDGLVSSWSAMSFSIDSAFRISFFGPGAHHRPDHHPTHGACLSPVHANKTRATTSSNFHRK